MLLAILCSSIVSNIDVVTQISHVDVWGRDRVPLEPACSVHAGAMLPNDWTLVCISGSGVPDMEQGENVVILGSHGESLPFIGGIAGTHDRFEACIAH